MNPMERLKAIDVERAKLMKALDVSYSIESLCPDAFSHGPCTTNLSDYYPKARHDAMGYGVYGYGHIRLVITKGNSEQVSVDKALWQLPDALLEPHLKQIETKQSRVARQRIVLWISRQRSKSNEHTTLPFNAENH